MVLLQRSPDGHYFGRGTWYGRFGHMMDDFLLFVFGPNDHIGEPIGRNKIDYIARLFFPLFYAFFIILYVIFTLGPYAVKYRI